MTAGKGRHFIAPHFAVYWAEENRKIGHEQIT